MWLVDLGEPGVLRRDLRVERERLLVAGVHDRARKGAQLRAAADHALERAGVLRVVAREHPGVGLGGGRLQDGAVLLRQPLPGLGVHEHLQRRAALPPAGVVVVLGHLVEAELLVVVRARPIPPRRSCRARAPGRSRRRRSAAAPRRASRAPGRRSPPMRILSPLRSAADLISLRNQPPIWAPVLPHRQPVQVVLLVELVHQRLAAALHTTTS